MTMRALSDVIAIILVLQLSKVQPAPPNTPIVLWHGMGDSCCFPFSLGAIRKKLNESISNGVYIKSLEIGESIVKDMENGFFLHPNEQINLACDIIKSDPQLKNGYNAIGFSQGAQFLRGLTQRCPDPPIKNLISLGGQHQGIYGLPHCASLSYHACDYLRKLLNHAAYLRWVQKSLVQATYWHDPLNEDDYKNRSSFLADINNEDTINTTYIKNLQKLQNLVLVKFEDDTIVQPVITEWFGFYISGQSIKSETLEESRIYKENRLGLKTMKEDGKLKFLSTPGDHLQFDWDWFQANIIQPYLIN